MNSGLKNKVVLVTGASGGIGSGIARAFAAEGTHVILHYRSNRTAVEQLKQELGDVECLTLQADLSREDETEALFQRALKHFGRIDTLVANAGAWELRDVPMHQMSLAQWQATLDNLLTGVFLSLRAFLQHVEQTQRGNAVLIASTAAVFGEAGHADYAAAKSALAYGLTSTIKNELGRLAPHTQDYCGGRINCVCPGWTVVPRTASKLMDEETARKVAATLSLPKVARPDDIANMVVFLASDRLAGHITGERVVVSGGMEGRQLWGAQEVDPSLM
ncbi:MAG: SDR family NAD(P)-dependent oxidoreductase [Verrucomicrobiota bacterium]|jgi:3-oxoacyl-[acyl-carrier protein] reductase